MASILKVDQIQSADGTVEYLNAGSIRNTTLHSSVSGTFNGTLGSSATFPTDVFMINYHHLFNYSSGRTKVTFGPTGSQQSWTVPTGISQFLIKLWGAGGAGGNAGGWGYASRGGGGGFSLALVPCTPGTTYYLVVGVGGQTNYTGGTTPRYGGGGGFVNNTGNKYTGSGGGLTGIFTGSTPSQSNAVLIAGGGGGGGSSRQQDGNGGGAGGGIFGQHGDSAYDSKPTYAGGGGTQSTGGTAIGTAGSALEGGRTNTNTYGGGGGGGYYGGGGGAYSEDDTMGGGGGGSGFINSSLTTYGAMFTGFRDKPAMSDDPDLSRTFDGYNNWTHFANGGEKARIDGAQTNLGGGGGYIVIYY